jgi:sulfite reductase (ferredoxin)
LGGGTGDGGGRIADKVIKIPSKQGPEGTLSYVLSDYEQNRTEEISAVLRPTGGKIYFYDLLKNL